VNCAETFPLRYCSNCAFWASLSTMRATDEDGLILRVCGAHHAPTRGSTSCSSHQWKVK
jgi:hypothetical protein